MTPYKFKQLLAQFENNVPKHLWKPVLTFTYYYYNQNKTLSDTTFDDIDENEQVRILMRAIYEWNRLQNEFLKNY